MPVVSSSSYRWLEDAVTEWQTSQGQLVQMGGLAGYTPKQVGVGDWLCVLDSRTRHSALHSMLQGW